MFQPPLTALPGRKCCPASFTRPCRLGVAPRSNCTHTHVRAELSRMPVMAAEPMHAAPCQTVASLERHSLATQRMYNRQTAHIHTQTHPHTHTQAHSSLSSPPSRTASHGVQSCAGCLQSACIVHPARAHGSQHPTPTHSMPAHASTDKQHTLLAASTEAAASKHASVLTTAALSHKQCRLTQGCSKTKQPSRSPNRKATCVC